MYDCVHTIAACNTHCQLAAAAAFVAYQAGICLLLATHQLTLCLLVDIILVVVIIVVLNLSSMQQ